MKKSTIIIGVLFTLSLIFSGCESTHSPKQDVVTINGTVNDIPVPFAVVRLVVYPSGKELATVIADTDGKWNSVINKDSIPADAFIMIFTTNPDNNSTIRSIIDTDEVLESEGNFTSEETTVSHYTEAAVIMAEDNIHQGAKLKDEVLKVKSLIRLDNGEPTKTGFNSLDELAAVVQNSFDDNSSSQNKLSLAVYGTLLQTKIASVVADKYGRVEVPLPVSYNKQIKMTANTSVDEPVEIVDKVLSFTLTSQEVLHDVNLTINVSLNENSLSKPATLYAKGNSKSHYIYSVVTPLSDGGIATSRVMKNGRYYTFVPYSYIAIEENNANNGVIQLNGITRGKYAYKFDIADNYQNTKVVVRVYEGKSVFDETTLVGESEIVDLNTSSVDFGDIVVSRINDFKPIVPKDQNQSLLPPVAVEF